MNVSHSLINCNFHAKFEVPTVVLMKIQVFWEVMSLRLISSYQHFGGGQCLNVQDHYDQEGPEDERAMFVRNVGYHLPVDVTNIAEDLILCNSFLINNFAPS